MLKFKKWQTLTALYQIFSKKIKSDLLRKLLMSLKNDVYLGHSVYYKNIHMCITRVYNIRRKAGMNKLADGEV